MQSNWTEAHSQALREYLEKGLSYSEIANAINERFNTDYSRNAAIGRAKRMGLSGPERPDRLVWPKRPRKLNPARLNKLRARALAEPKPKPKPKSKPKPGLRIFERAAALKLRCVGIVPRHLSLLELDDGDCRYPYGGDADGEAITFCGHPRREGSSYCTSHFHLTSGPATVSERAAGRAPLRLVEAA
jgi:GcrA cell cycle regulator